MDRIWELVRADIPDATRDEARDCLTEEWFDGSGQQRYINSAPIEEVADRVIVRLWSERKMK